MNAACNCSSAQTCCFTPTPAYVNLLYDTVPRNTGDSIKYTLKRTRDVNFKYTNDYSAGTKPPSKLRTYV